MKSKTGFLLKTFLTSTSDLNVLKHSQDKNKRKYAKNNLLGQVMLYVIMAVYGTMLGVGLGKTGNTEQIPTMCAEFLFLMPLLFTLLKTNGYLFGFREYDMLMSMPFSVKDIVSAKFLYMYIKSLPMFMLISVAMLIGYAVGGGLTLWGFFAWIILSFFLPIFPMLLASVLGSLVVKIGSGFRNKNIVQAILIIILIMPLFFSRYFIENTVRTDNIENVMATVGDSADSMAAYVPFAKWFSEAINDGRISSSLLIIAVVICVYELIFMLISKFYRQINSKLSEGTNHRNYHMTVQKQKSMVQAIAIKEFKRMTGSSVYFVNVGLGEIFALIFGIAMLFIKADVIIKNVMPGAPVTPTMIYPAIPIFIYFFLGMVPTTCCSPSLEGKNYWIMQTLPIDPMDDNKGKILFNLYLTIPFGILATITSSICFGAAFLDGFTSMIAVVSLCIFSTVFGLRSGLKHRRLDWENEIEVIKQGMGVSMYIIPHIIVSMLLLPGVVFLNIFIKNVPIIMLAITFVAWILTLLSWKSVKKYTR